MQDINSLTLIRAWQAINNGDTAGALMLLDNELKKIRKKMTEAEALIALNLIPEIGSTRLRNLSEAFDSAPKIFLNSENTLKKIDKIGDKIARAIARFSLESLEIELALTRKLQVKVITLRDEAYPKLLKEIYGPPLCVYVKGSALALWGQPLT